MTIAPARPVTLALGEFEDIISRGLQALFNEDPHVQLVATDVPPERVDSTLSMYQPDVALLNYGSLRSPGELRDLHDAHPGTRLLVLANHPSSAECRQLIGFGATACLAKSTEARDVLHAIHLASRGLHVMPRSAPTRATSTASSGSARAGSCALRRSEPPGPGATRVSRSARRRRTPRRGAG